MGVLINGNIFKSAIMDGAEEFIFCFFTFLPVL